MRRTRQGGQRTAPEAAYPILSALTHEEAVVVEGRRHGGTSTGHLDKGEPSRPLPLSIARELVEAGHAVMTGGC